MVTGVEISGDDPVEVGTMTLRIDGSGRVTTEKLTAGRVAPTQVLNAALQAVTEANQVAKDAQTGAVPELLLVARLATGEMYVAASTGDGAVQTALLDELCAQLGISN